MLPIETCRRIRDSYIRSADRVLKMSNVAPGEAKNAGLELTSNTLENQVFWHDMKLMLSLWFVKKNNSLRIHHPNQFTVTTFFMRIEESFP